jgi:hypothetical protein
MDPSTRPELFVLLVMVAPAIVAGVVLLVGALARRGQPLAWIGALAAGLAYAVGHFFALPAPPKFPPGEAAVACFWAGLLALFVGVLVGWRRRNALVNSVLVAIAACGGAYFVLQRMVARMTGSEQIALFGAVAIASVLSVLGSERTASVSKGAAAPLGLWIAATAAALSFVLSGVATYASYAAVLACLLGAALVVAVLRRGVDYSRGLSIFVVLQLTFLCAAGAYVSELPRLAAVLLTIAPALSGLVGAGRTEAWGTKRNLVVRAVLVGLPAVAAVALCAYERSQRVASPYDY